MNEHANVKVEVALEDLQDWQNKSLAVSGGLRVARVEGCREKRLERSGIPVMKMHQQRHDVGLLGFA